MRSPRSLSRSARCRSSPRALPPGLANHSEDVDAQGKLQVSADRLYHIAGLDGMQESTVELRFEQPGVRVYAFTFGS